MSRAKKGTRRQGKRSDFGNVRKLASSGRWQARYRDRDGEHNPTPGVTYATEKEAWNALKAFDVDRRRGVLPIQEEEVSKVETIGDFAWRWLAAHHTAETPPNTRVDYESIVRLGINRPGTPLDGLVVADVTPLAVRGWLAALSQPWVNPATGKQHPAYGPGRRKKAFRILSMVCKAAVGEELRMTNPCDNITPVPKGAVQSAKREHYFLYLYELARLNAAADYVPHRHHEDWGLFYELLTWTGMRPGEVRALRPEQVNVEARLIRVDAAVSDGSKKVDMKRVTPKSGRYRYAYAPLPVMERLATRISAMDSQQLVFPGEDGVSFMWASTYKEQAWVPMCGIAGVGPDLSSWFRGRQQNPITYDLRAAYITHMRSADVPFVDIGAQVGHVDQATSDLYTVIANVNAEDPIAIRARTETNKSRSDVVDFLYAEAQATL